MECQATGLYYVTLPFFYFVKIGTGLTHLWQAGTPIILHNPTSL